MPPWPASDPLVQATALLSEGRGASLFVWRPGARAPGPEVEDLPLDVEGARLASGQRLSGSALASWLVEAGAAAHPSASVGSFAAVGRLARELLRRGAVRPRIDAQPTPPTARWVAAPDLAEREAVAAIVRAAPPVAYAPLREAAPATIDHPWRAVRAILDELIDTAVRASDPPRRYGTGSLEGELEDALAGRSAAVQPIGTRPRARRALSDWETAARAALQPKPRLVLRLDLAAGASRIEPAAPGSAATFILSFAVDSKELSNRPPVPMEALWTDSPEAHLLADELEPVRAAMRDALHRAGAIVAPIEVSLAAAHPTAATLAAPEAWALVTKQRSLLASAGARLEVAEELTRVEDRFPRARVRLTRADGGGPEEPSLGAKYAVTWEVASQERILSATALRHAGRAAPLALVDGRLLPITAEAGERLARVAEREPVEWTGPLALAAALAGGVRQPGDLADALVVTESGLAQLIEELGRDVEAVPPPSGLEATLRAYQARGLAWLWHRTRLGLGALLADDMGLGKTVQLIALLELLRERGADDGPTLLVCPASLVGNWERELERFAPALSFRRHHGDARERDAQELASGLGPHDVVLTTYSLVRRDLAVLSQVGWGTVVCDESQALKNPQAAQARAVRTLNAKRRVALTGTPVENRLTELWAQMEFLNPGLLGPLERFRRELALPIERERDARALRWLKAATAPFLLRRMKTDPDIAPELPEKEVIRVYCSLSKEQARLYQRAVDESLNTLDEATGIERQGRVLKLLTRLKQICNHPALVPQGELGAIDEVRKERGPEGERARDETMADLAAATGGRFGGRSGKLERATEMIEEIVESGERTLLFTQYVATGRLIVEHLGSVLGLAVPLFHGGLGLEERDDIVRRFQDDPNGAPVLVMSLKAGGVGLNLTRASHVVHFDRWWNPAVEDQATDRAHRIGQTQRVQVHLLITMGTLEERIDRMLEEKRSLAGAVVEAGESWIASLSTDELRALVSLGSDAAVESVESWSGESAGS